MVKSTGFDPVHVGSIPTSPANLLDKAAYWNKLYTHDLGDACIKLWGLHTDPERIEIFNLFTALEQFYGRHGVNG